MTSTKIILTEANFGTPITALTSNDVVKGLVSDVCGLRTDSELFLSRITTTQTYNINEFDSVTIPSGMQWAAGFINDNGTAVCSAPTWITNTTGKSQTYSVWDATNYASYTGAKQIRISFGWISGAILEPEQLDSGIYINVNPALQELRLTSEYFLPGQVQPNGMINKTGDATRIGMVKPIRLEKWSKIYVPSALKWGVIYSKLDNTYFNSLAWDAWTETSGEQTITSAVKQPIASCPGAARFQIGLGLKTNDKLSVSSLDSTYTVKLIK